MRMSSTISSLTLPRFNDSEKKTQFFQGRSIAFYEIRNQRIGFMREKYCIP
jgi:hypothetical protein